MDPDEVDSAGTHQNHDLLTGNPPSSGGSGGTGSWTCHLLRRGWDLTRKAAIAGAAATAAPVVVPPLVVLSAAGVALSVPFAAYLASLAVTNHVMGALLRCSAPQPYHHQEDDDLEQEFLDASEEYGHDAPAFGRFNCETEQGEKDESDTSLLLLLPRDHGVSEAPFAADAEEVGGEFSLQEYGQESYTTNRGDETEEHTPVEGKEALRRGFGFGVPVSAQPLFADEDNQVKKEGEGEFTLLDSGQQSFQSENRNEKGADVDSENKEEENKTVKEHKPTKETVSQGFYFPASGDNDNVVQEKGEGEISVQDSGQQSFESKNWNEEEEVSGKTTGENKAAKETLSQGFYFPELRVPASVNKDDIVQEKGEGEFSAQNLGQYSLLSSMGDKKEQSITMEKKKSTEDMPQRDTVVSESSVPVFRGEDDGVQSKDGFEVAEQEVLKEANSNTDLVMCEAADVQAEIISIAAPESGVLPVSNLAARETQMDLFTGEVVDVDVGIAAAAEPESEVLHPTSESLAGPVTEESVDAQVVIVAAAVPIVAAAVPGSEELPLSSLAACEPQAVAETAHAGEAVGITVMEEIVRDFGDLSKEEDVKAMEENKSKSSNETVSQGFRYPESRVPSSGDNDKVVQDNGGGEFSAQNSSQYSFSSNARYKKKQGITEENKSARDTPSRDFDVSGSLVPVLHGEDDVVQSNKGFVVDVMEVAEEANSVADLVTGEAADVQLEIVAIAAPESEELPPSNLVACESPADLITGEVVDVCASTAAAVEPESQGRHPSNLATSESPTGPVTEEIVDVQVDIIAAVTPGSEVLPLSSLAACESQAVAETAHVSEVTGITVMGEVAEVQVGIIATAAPETESEVLPQSNVVARELLSDFAAAVSESEVLHPGNLATSESPADPVTREIVAAQADIIAAAMPESEELPLTSLAACESQALAETAHVGEVIGITVMEDIVMDIGDVEGVSFVPVVPPHDGEDVMSSGNTPYLSIVEEEMIDQPNQLTGVGYTVTDEAFGSRDVAGGEADYTEEQLREQLDTIRTITGYRAVPSSTLEGELAGIYIFVGVEPAVDSVDTSDRLMELNAKLRFLKSIIGVD